MSNSSSNPESRACARRHGPDCRYLKSAISWWCVNKACSKLRGTNLPGVINCPFYKPPAPRKPVSETCKTCRWWHSRTATSGRCHRYPPPRNEPPQIVRCDDWCGEWISNHEHRIASFTPPRTTNWTPKSCWQCSPRSENAGVIVFGVFFVAWIVFLVWISLQ
jgi:hypothetical protein